MVVLILKKNYWESKKIHLINLLKIHFDTGGHIEQNTETMKWTHIDAH